MQLEDLISRLRPQTDGTALIRLGPLGDGGYLVPDDLDGDLVGFSPGVGTVSGFEAALAARGIPVFLADYSVAAPPITNELFQFEPRYLRAVTSEVSLTFDEWKRRAVGDFAGDTIVQMDIEGDEYEVLLNISDQLLSQVRIFVIEFHGLNRLLSSPFFALASRAFERLLQSHAVVHIHPNNCCGLVRSSGFQIPRIAEFTFHRRDRLGPKVSLRNDFPHELDADNTSNPALPLPESWFG